MIHIIGPREVTRQLDSLQGMAEQYPGDRQTELIVEWLDLRFPTGSQYRHLVVAVVDAVRSYVLHRYHNADGVPFHHVFEAIGRMRDAMYDDPNALHVASPREQGDFADALAALGLHNWHDPDEFACVFSSGAPGTSGYDLAARMIVHKDGRAVLEIDVALLVEWAAWPTAPKAPSQEGQAQR